MTASPVRVLARALQMANERAERWKRRNDEKATHLANLAAAIEARADELAGPYAIPPDSPVLIERDGYVNGLRAAAEIVRAHTNP